VVGKNMGVTMPVEQPNRRVVGEESFPLLQRRWSPQPNDDLHWENPKGGPSVQEWLKEFKLRKEESLPWGKKSLGDAKADKK